MPSRFLHALHHGFLYHVIRLCRIRAASEQVARGFALGIMPHFFPTFGFGAIISAFLARACGGHGVAGLVSGALFTPFWPFFFYLNLRVGGWLRGSHVAVQSMDEVTEERAQRLMWGRDFSVGGIVNAVLAALIAYLLLVAIYERVRPGLLAHFRRQARARRKTRRLVAA